MDLPPPDAALRRLRVLVADDEPAARDKLARLLKAHDDIELVGMASNGEEAARLIKALSPEVVLLDIRMPELDGFAVIDHAKGTSSRFHTIFVTAYDEYATRAFDVRALDYLLKPFDAERLSAALLRAREQLALERQAQGEEVAAASVDLLAQLRPPSAEAEIEGEPAGYIERICIKSVGSTRIVRVRDIEWIEAYGNYVRLHTPNDHPLARDTLRRLLTRLDPTMFCRVHRGAIVNINKIRHMRPTVSGDHVMRLDSGTRLRLSRGYRAELLRRMAQ